MPILDRTSLNLSDKLHLLAKATVCQDYGDITLLSDEFQVSRKTIRKVKKEGLSLLSAALTPTGSTTKVTVDIPQLKRTIISLSMNGVNSIRAIEDSIPLIYPGVSCSFGYIQAVQIEAQTNAAIFNSQVDLSAIVSAAIDELFCQGDPVLAGIDLDSSFLFSLAHEACRDGKTWARILNEAKYQGLALQHIVKDGAKGMTKGVNDVFPLSEQRDDAFHALYITSKSVFKVEKRAYRLIEQEYQLGIELNKASKKQFNKGGSKMTADEKQKEIEGLREALADTTEKCSKAVARFDHANNAYRYLHRALSSVHINEHINLMSPTSAKTLLKLSARYLIKARHPDCSDAARYIKNRLDGLTFATADFYQKQQALCVDYPQDMVALACYFHEYNRSLKKVPKKKQPKVKQKMLGAYALIYKALSQSKADKLMQTIEQLLRKRHRASSAIEGFNALLRPYMYVRKGVSQGFLELFKAWHNLRPRRTGRYKSTSPYETLTGQPVDDWLTILGFPPSNATH
jgi:menaquinone-dependent protoporphyrinogen IX oxidase